MQVKYQEILAKNPRHKKTFCDIFCYEPETIEESSLGSLYIVAELQSDENPSRMVNLLNSMIKREYYYSPHRGSLESLETSLKKANMSLNEMAKQGNLSWLGKLHLVCAVINKSDLFLSQSGRACAWLCREGELTDITKKYADSQEKPHPAKIFQNVISGNIDSCDKFFLGTPAFLDFFGGDRLKKLLIMPRVEQIALEINETINGQKKLSPFGALLMEMRQDEISPEIKKNQTKFVTPPIGLDEILE